MSVIVIRPELEIPQEEIDALCLRRNIVWLAVFGSVLRDDFSPTSDIDLIVEFAPDSTPSIFGMLDLEREFSELLEGRKIDLGTKRSLNKWIRERVLNEARVIYDAA